MSLPAHKKVEVVKKVLLKDKKVSEVAKEVGVSRKTVYSWINKYQESSLRNKKQALSPKYIKGKKHHRAIAYKAKNTLKRLIISHPDWSTRKLSRELKNKSINLGTFGVHKLLKSLNASTFDERINFRRNFSGPGRLAGDIKLSIINRVIEEKESVSSLSKEFGVARKTVYKWINKYKTNTLRGLAGAQAIKDNYVKGEHHPKAIYPYISEEVLGVVARKPALSVNQLSQIVGASNWTVWKILDRNSLNNYQQRLAYSGQFRPTITPVVPQGLWARVRYVLEQFVTGLAPAPPSAIVTIWSFVRTFTLSSVISFASVYSLIWWVSFISTRALANAIGIVFATSALAMGSVFFLYSLKYYLSLAIVLSFSQQEASSGERLARSKKRGLLSWLLGLAKNGNGNGDATREDSKASGPVGLTPNLEHVTLKKHPKVSVHIPLYNEKKVVERAIAAATSFDYQGDYEVVLCDDSTDETTTIIRDYQLKHLRRGQKLEKIENKAEGWVLTSGEVKPGVTLKHLHRTSRSGFKGGALRLALRLTDPKVEFISVFDADFVPYPDTLELFLKYFKVQNQNSEEYQKSNVAAVQGYQWHVLNKSENWITRGVRSEYAGSYVIERSGEEIYQGLKQISGAVYMIRRDVLDEVGWETSITEDFQLTLKLYEKGYKVVYTPYIQAPAECVSTLKRLIRQRMRWAEGHSNNIKRMFTRLLFGHWEKNPGQSTIVNRKSNHSVDGLRFTDHQSQWVPSPLTLSEKFEFLYLSPYYLQAFFFLFGTLSWLISETIFSAGLPFWTNLWGWSLVLTNFLSLPLMNAVGLFLEESEERDYQGLVSFVLLSYLLVPFQAYASIKGFLFKEEGPWFRTPKTGKITDVFRRGTFYRFISGILPGRTAPVVARANEMRMEKARIDSNNSHGLALNNSLNNSYLALTTANSRFNSFSVKPRKIPFVGKALVIVILVISLTLTTFAPFIPVGSPTGIQARIGLPKILADRAVFKAGENPSFVLDVGDNSARNPLSLVSDAKAAGEYEVQTGLYRQGEKVDIPIRQDSREDGKLAIDVEGQENFKPGKYQLRTVVKKGGRSIMTTQDFTWGVLAINTNKSIFTPGETAYLQMAVLDDQGEMACNSKTTLNIKRSGEGEVTTLSTDEGTIKVNQECKEHDITFNPDYEAEFVVGEPGMYELTLTATTKNGTREINDSFEVRESVAFDIERYGPTRIYPPANYPVTFEITANQDYKGKVVEALPLSFKVENHQAQEIDLTGEEQKLIWEVDWREGEVYELSYEFNAPNTSPELYLLGPLKIGTRSEGTGYKHSLPLRGREEFRESRQWQIAADALASYVKSLEHVTIALTTSSPVSTNLTKSQTITDLVPFATQEATGTDDDWDATLVDLYFESGPKITAARSSNSGSVTLSVFVVEFDTTKVDVQQGTITSFSGASTTETVTTVTSSKAAMVFYYENRSGDDDWDHSSVAGWFSDTSTLTFERDADNGTINGHYYVFEAQNTEFSVISGDFNYSGTSGTDTISSVTMNKSFVIASYRSSTGNDDADAGAAIVYLSAATTVTSTRYHSGDEISDIRYFVVSFAGDETVQRGNFTYSGGGSSDTDTITEVDTAVAMAWNVITKPGTMRSDSDSSGDVDEGWQRITITNSTTVQGERWATGTTAQGAWEVIEWKGPSGDVVVDQTSDNQTASMTITSVDNDLTAAFTFTASDARTVNTIIIAEQGTVDAAADVDNIELYSETDTSAPYDCEGESYGGGEDQFGSTDTDGFDGVDGDASFTETGGEAISATATLCVYVVLDITSGATDDETLEIQITDPSNDVSITAGTVAPDSAVALNGTTTLNTPSDPDQLHYRWRNDDGYEETQSGDIAIVQTINGTILSGTPLTLPSWTPQADELILLSIGHRDENDPISSVTGNGLTFVEVRNVINTQGQMAVTVYRAMGSSPTTGSITISIGSDASHAVAASATRFSGIDTSGTNGSGAVEVDIGNVGPASDNNDMKDDITTLTNGAWAFGVGSHRDEVFTVPAGETEVDINVLAAAGGGADATVSTWYESVPTATTVTVGADNDIDVNTDWAMITISIKPGAGTSAATFAKAEDTKFTDFPQTTTYRVRFLVHNQGGGLTGNVQYKLQVAQTATCSSGSYADVPGTATTEHWEIVDSDPYITDGEATANIDDGVSDALTDPVGGATFQAGELRDNNTNKTGNIDLDGNIFTEIEFAVQATTNSVIDANYCFRLIDDLGGETIDYTKYAEATVVPEYTWIFFGIGPLLPGLIARAKKKRKKLIDL